MKKTFLFSLITLSSQFCFAMNKSRSDLNEFSTSSIIVISLAVLFVLINSYKLNRHFSDQKKKRNTLINKNLNERIISEQKPKMEKVEVFIN